MNNMMIVFLFEEFTSLCKYSFDFYLYKILKPIEVLVSYSIDCLHRLRYDHKKLTVLEMSVMLSYLHGDSS